MILQILCDKEYETLEVKNDGRIICSCINNLYHKGREENSICKHAQELRNSILKGDITKYNIIKD